MFRSLGLSEPRRDPLRRGRTRPRQQLRQLHYLLHLKVPTLRERMKAANPAARVIAVAGKDHAAVMTSGHDADQVRWWARESSAMPTAPNRPPSPASTRSSRRRSPESARAGALRFLPVPRHPGSRSAEAGPWAPAASRACRAIPAPPAHRRNSTPRPSRSQAACPRRCGSDEAGRPTCSSSAARPATMSATATAPRAPSRSTFSFQTLPATGTIECVTFALNVDPA